MDYFKKKVKHFMDKLNKIQKIYTQVKYNNNFNFPNKILKNFMDYFKIKILKNAE